jgi:hypothetical protein
MRKPPDAEALKAYNDIFRSPLGSEQHKAIRALFTENCLPAHDPIARHQALMVVLLCQVVTVVADMGVQLGN